MPKKTRPDSEEARLKRDTEDIMNRVMLLGMRYFKLQLNRKIEEMEAGLGYSAGEPVLETASQTFVKKGLSPTHKTAISQGQRKRWQGEAPGKSRSKSRSSRETCEAGQGGAGGRARRYGFFVDNRGYGRGCGTRRTHIRRRIEKARQEKTQCPIFWTGAASPDVTTFRIIALAGYGSGRRGLQPLVLEEFVSFLFWVPLTPGPIWVIITMC